MKLNANNNRLCCAEGLLFGLDKVVLHVNDQESRLLGIYFGFQHFQSSGFTYLAIFV